MSTNRNSIDLIRSFGNMLYIKIRKLIIMKISELLEKDINRIDDFTKYIDLKNESIYFDFAKTHISKSSLTTLYKLIDEKRIYKRINGMFEGEKINYTENREVLHVYLRDKDLIKALREERPFNLTEKKNYIYTELMRMKNFIEKIYEGKILGITKKKIRTIVNIGIGGSDLGPRMVCEALRAYANPDMNVHFISNIDATDTIEVFKKIDPETTLFIVVSKTFTTLETIENYQLALRYMSDSMKMPKDEVSKHHFIAVSSNIEETKKHNIQTVFAMWDFVGGRYSLWSPVGLIIALFIGFDNFLNMLEGASKIDEEFRTKQGTDNVQIFHALIEIFYSRNNYDNKCIVSYDQYLEKLYLYLQQAEMESNGKYSEKEDTGMVIWGGVGTNAQHSFFQLLHQGTRKILTEFIFPMNPIHKEEEFHQMVISNCLAQSRALMLGKDGIRNKDHFEGDRPSITIGYSRLSPKTLGALLAHYEHKIFVQGVFWNINSFDQFGVTLGKSIATQLLDSIKNEDCKSFDESTNALLKRINKK